MQSLFQNRICEIPCFAACFQNVSQQAQLADREMLLYHIFQNIKHYFYHLKCAASYIPKGYATDGQRWIRNILCFNENTRDGLKYTDQPYIVIRVFTVFMFDQFKCFYLKFYSLIAIPRCLCSF